MRVFVLIVLALALAPHVGAQESHRTLNVKDSLNKGISKTTLYCNSRDFYAKPLSHSEVLRPVYKRSPWLGGLSRLDFERLMRQAEPWNRAVLNRIPEADRFPRQIEKVVCKLLLDQFGNVREVKIEKSSGDAGCDAKAEAFLRKYQPYPPPPDLGALMTGLLVYFDGDMGLTMQLNDGKSEPPVVFYK